LPLFASTRPLICGFEVDDGDGGMCWLIVAWNSDEDGGDVDDDAWSREADRE